MRNVSPIRQLVLTVRGEATLRINDANDIAKLAAGKPLSKETREGLVTIYKKHVTFGDSRALAPLRLLLIGSGVEPKRLGMRAERPSLTAFMELSNAEKFAKLVAHLSDGAMDLFDKEVATSLTLMPKELVQTAGPALEDFPRRAVLKLGSTPLAIAQEMRLCALVRDDRIFGYSLSVGTRLNQDGNGLGYTEVFGPWFERLGAFGGKR